MRKAGRTAIRAIVVLCLSGAAFAQYPTRFRTLDSGCDEVRSTAKAYLKKLGFRQSKVKDHANRVGLVANHVRGADGARIGEDELVRFLADPPAQAKEDKPRLLPAQYAMGFWTADGPRWVSGSMEFQQLERGCQVGMALLFPKGVLLLWAFLPVDSDMGWFTSNGELESRYLAEIEKRLPPGGKAGRP